MIDNSKLVDAFVKFREKKQSAIAMAICEQNAIDGLPEDDQDSDFVCVNLDDRIDCDGWNA